MTSRYGLLIIVQSVLYGLMDALLKLVYRDVPVSCFLSVRFVLAVLIFLALWHKTILADLKSAPLRSYLLPCACLAASTVACNMAVQLTDVSTVVFLKSLSCALTPLLLILLFHQQCTGKDIALCLCITTGLFLLCTKNGLPQFGGGEVLALTAAVLLALSLIYSARSLTKVHATTLSFVQTACAAVICLVMGLAQGGWSGQSLALVFTERNLVILVYGIIGCTIGGYLLQNIALPHLSARTTGLLQGTYPVCAALFAWGILGESMTARALCGAALILLSSLAAAGHQHEAQNAARSQADVLVPHHSGRRLSARQQ